jgi:prophage maintenance system killer protein
VSPPLSAADLRFINRIASRRCAGGEPGAVDDPAIDAALAAAGEGTPFVRVATLAATLLQRRAFASAPLPTALLTLHCALTLEGMSLIAPQGVAAGMIRGLAADGNVATLARWLEDRAVPSASS